ncbi:OpgC domain-containing protein [Nocardioides psychrotolerans]|uniref:OpgC domain-containing protein n=1 Tax=Nocardioides psychrotolerans TaxID=1005945 RepID=UPI00313781A1
MKHHLRPAVVLGLAAAMLLPLLTLALVVPAQAADDTMPRPGPGAPWFGPELDIETAVPQDYADALGAAPSSFTFQVDYPISGEDEVFLERQVRAIATLGAVVVVDLQPRTPLEGLGLADAEAFGELLDGLHDELGTWFLARFGAEMNGSWEPWGQQAVAYKAAFRVLAEGLDTTAPHVETVWSPVYGSGYPYREEQGADGDIGLPDEVDVEPLDTNGDGRLAPGDDPYGPYFPGDDVVDWVGLTLYRFGQDQGIESNVVPTGEYDARLAETWGYGDGTNGRPFYDRFAAAGDRPMLVQTSALYNPAVEGATELELKRSWWRQVFGSSTDHPLIGLISWLEVDRIEPEVDTAAVDWRVTADPEIAAAIRSDLERSTVDLGPVSDPVEDTTPRDADGNPIGDGGSFVPVPGSDLPAGVTPDPGARALGIGGLALLALLGLALLARTRSGWASVEDGVGSRDPRLDLARGALLVLVVAGHVGVVLGHLGTARSALGVLPVAEALVLLSGLAIASSPVVRSLRRAMRLYAVAVLTALGVYVASLVPGVEAGRLLGLRDPATGQVRDLFPDADHLFDYPTPWDAARRLLFLEMGPWATSIIGLFVLLGLAVPLVLLLLRRRLWWVALLVSWALWALGQVWHPSWAPAQFADTYPPLAWQLLFVHGLALGHHRRSAGAWLRGRAGTLVAGLAVTAYAGVVGWWWATGRTLDADFWGGVDLPVGRVALVVATGVVATAVLTACWRPLASTVGRVLVPLGRHPVAVLVGHVAVLLVIATVIDR